jgi:RNA polymerase sigma-70 factor (ECF subfamily)
MEFRKIYDQYYSRVRKFILAIVKDEWAADDLIQETFVKIRKNMDTIRDPSKMSSWIYRTAYNLCQDHFRSLKKSALNGRETRQKPTAMQEFFIEKELEQRQMGACVQDQMDFLPESLRTVLVLYDVMDFSQKEIAEILDITVENVKVRLHRARKKFKAILEEKCTFEHDERNVLTCDPKGSPKNNSTV